jgi:hypothetical protein
MFKLILILFGFYLFTMVIEPTPSVKELTNVNKTYCKDICK